MSVPQLARAWEKKDKLETDERNPGASKHRKTGIDLSWVLDFPWLETSEETIEPEMWYTPCRKNNYRPRCKRVPLGKAVWTEVPR